MCAGPSPTAEEIEAALQALGVAAINAKGARIGFASPVRDTVTGWVVSIDSRWAPPRSR